MSKGNAMSCDYYKVRCSEALFDGTGVKLSGCRKISKERLRPGFERTYVHYMANGSHIEYRKIAH
jgi:hypothetical protein